MSSSSGSDAPEQILSGALLRSLREAAGLSQSEVRAAVGGVVSQAGLSRIETGRERPTPARVEALLTAYGVESDLRRSLIVQAEALALEHADGRTMLQDGKAWKFQQRIADAERNAEHVRSFQPVTVLGVLQTAAYARAVFDPAAGDIKAEDAERSVGVRMRRWESLADPRRRWTLIQTEQGLRWPLVSYLIQADQLDQITEASRLPNVRIGIIPLDTLAPEQSPAGAFHLYDDTSATVGTLVGTTLIENPARLADLQSAFRRVERLAVWGEDARGILAGFSRDYREKAARDS